MNFSDNSTSNFIESFDDKNWSTVGPKKTIKNVVKKKKQSKYVAKSQKINLDIKAQHKKVMAHEDAISTVTNNDNLVIKTKNSIKEDIINENEEEEKEEELCYCKLKGCHWDCGTLWCGCIDVCRGRCGFSGDRYWR